MSASGPAHRLIVAERAGRDRLAVTPARSGLVARIARYSLDDGVAALDLEHPRGRRVRGASGVVAPLLKADSAHEPQCRHFTHRQMRRPGSTGWQTVTGPMPRTPRGALAGRNGESAPPPRVCLSRPAP
jgi:hypothetical protein